MASTGRQLHFNAFLMSCGHHEAAWRLPGGDPFAGLDLGHWTNLARIAERGTFEADALPRPSSRSAPYRRWSPTSTSRSTTSSSTSPAGGTGELKQYDVSDPAHPREVRSVRLGGITGRVAHPAAPDESLAGGPQMVEVSRDGKRIYLTDSLYGSWDDQFYPDGVGSWFAKLDTDPAAGGGLSLDEKFFPHGEEFCGRRVHQVRLGGGDASCDSYCYPS